MNGTYAIYTLFDDNFFATGYTMIYSLLKNNPWFDGDINILTDDNLLILSDEHKKMLVSLSNHIKFVKVSHDDYSALLENQAKMCDNPKHLSCFYKLEIFKGFLRDFTTQ